jgi:hypothetical protein
MSWLIRAFIEYIYGVVCFEVETFVRETAEPGRK